MDIEKYLIVVIKFILNYISIKEITMNENLNKNLQNMKPMQIYYFLKNLNLMCSNCDESKKGYSFYRNKKVYKICNKCYNIQIKKEKENEVFKIVESILRKNNSI